MSMPKGKYFVGDLCYVMHDCWDEFCNTTIDLNTNECLEGEFEITKKNGKIIKVASYGTKYGDGTYEDQAGNDYPVDAGLIGCILLSDIDFTNEENKLEWPHSKAGQVVNFENEFNTSENEGKISFGHIKIDTDPETEDDELGEYDEDYEEDENEAEELEEESAEDN